MTFLKRIFLFLVLVSMVSCNSSKPEHLEELNLKNYFFHPSWFETAKIYEYEVIVNDSSKHSLYKHFKCVDKNKLECIVYDRDFRMSSIETYEYLQDKVILNSLVTIGIWDNDLHYKEDIIDSVVFVYKNINNQFSSSYSSRTSKSQYTKSINRSLKSIDSKIFNDKNIQVVLADGETKFEFKSKNLQGQTAIYKQNVTYAENIGIIYEESKAQKVQLKSSLKNILSKSEFTIKKNER